MFDIVILLAGAAERPVLRSLLLGHNPGLTVMAVETREDLAALSLDQLRRARLVAFVTPEIVPASILARLGYGAFNFHPGPPAYPGWAPSHFALYDQVTEFGATAHIMVEQVDAGPILDVSLFPIPPDISVLGLEGLAYAHLALLFWRMSKSLATDPEPPPARPIPWAPSNTPAAPIGRFATSPSIFQSPNSTGALKCSAGTISAWRRPSSCTESSFAQSSHPLPDQEVEPDCGRRVSFAHQPIGG